MRLKNVLLIGAACAYVGTGVAAYHLVAAITSDPTMSNWVACGLAAPLAWLLLRALGGIETLR